MKLQASAFLLCALVGWVLCNEAPILKIANGLIRGTVQKTLTGKDFYAFEGIPYAKPPVGDLRLRDPKPAEPWTGIWEAAHTYECLQIDHVPENPLRVQGTEDCLYVNVYTPNIIDDDLFDVIVHFHGGAFMFGRGDYYGPKILMDRNVVYVNVNYRLGPLGFLSTGDDNLPGNYGLKDQVLALKWVRENIRNFNGNPKSVTITGCSAGGASVHFHYLSPLSKGLFHKGISASGTALSPWALVEDPLPNTKKLGTFLGCGQTNLDELVDCIRRRPGQQITQHVKHFLKWLYVPFTPFGPVVEKQGKSAFLPGHPYDLMKAGRVHNRPWITSVTEQEGLYPGAGFHRDDYLEYLDKNWDELGQYILHFEETLGQTQIVDVLQKVRKHYLGDEPISKETFPKLIQLIGDRLFISEGHYAAKLQASVVISPVYFYKFCYRGAFSFTEYWKPDKEDLGVCHADDIMYIFSGKDGWFKSYLTKKADKKMSRVMTDVYTTFAKTGKPHVNGVDWTPVSRNIDDKFTLLTIKSPSKLLVEAVDELGDRTFWESLPIQEADKMYTTKDEL